MTHEVPEGWTTKQVEDILLPVKGAMKIGPFGSQLKKSDILGGPFKVYGQENVFASDFSLGERFVSEEKFQQLRSCQLFPGDLVLTMMGTIGKVAVCPSNLEQGIMDSHLLRLQCDPSVVLTEYVRHLFAGSKLIYEQVARMSQGGIMAGLNSKIVRSLLVPLPPLPEQKKIAEVLSSVDEAIAATKAVIDQTKQVKKGLLQTLLTKGIGHTKFKQTELGEIPKSWEVVKLEDLLADTATPMRSGPFGSALKKAELVESGIPLLGIDNVYVDRFQPTYKRFITPEKFDELKRYAVYPQDVMITIMGTVGRCCVVPEGVGDMLSSKHVWTMTFDKQMYIPELICWQLNYAPWVLKEFWRTSQGGVMAAISSKILRTLTLPKPPLKEQEKIAEVLASKNEFIHANLAKLNHLYSIKSGLMTDLLSGRKRVEV